MTLAKIYRQWRNIRGIITSKNDFPNVKQILLILCIVDWYYYSVLFSFICVIQLNICKRD